MKPFARILLGEGAPVELESKLRMIGLDPLTLGESEQADFHVEFRGKIAPVNAAVPILTIVPGGSVRDETVSTEPILDSPIAIACLVLSRVLGMPSPILTANGAMFAVVRAAMTLAQGRSRILIEGGIGSGKSLLAGLIHAASRSKAEIVRIDCAGLDSEPATGWLDVSRTASAHETDDADMEPAPSRVIYLNHVNELSWGAQLKLTAILKSPRQDPEKLDEAVPAIRYIASLGQAATESIVRGELMPELRALFDVTLTIPPLDARPEDVTLLAQYFLRGVNSEVDFSQDAIEALQSYSFPGSVRELRNLVTRIGIMHSSSRTSTIERGDVAAQLLAAAAARLGASARLPKARRDSTFVSSKTIAHDPASSGVTDDSHPLMRLVPAHNPARKPRGGSSS